MYSTIEIQTMSLTEGLEILYKHFFSIAANSTNQGIIPIQEFILVRNKNSYKADRG